MRNVQWDVVVPLGLEWEFMKAFGEAFRLNDAHEGTNFIRPIDGYHEHPSGWHIQVTVNETDETRLLEFCKGFFGSREISFREPEVPAHPWAMGFLKLLKKDVVIGLKSGKVLKGKVALVSSTWVSVYSTDVGHNVHTDFQDIHEVTEEALLVTE